MLRMLRHFRFTPIPRNDGLFMGLPRRLHFITSPRNDDKLSVIANAVKQSVEGWDCRAPRASLLAMTDLRMGLLHSFHPLAMTG